jgi:drug/metabolite transporter (DMT)-like permease
MNVTQVVQEAATEQEGGLFEPIASAEQEVLEPQEDQDEFVLQDVVIDSKEINRVAEQLEDEQKPSFIIEKNDIKVPIEIAVDNPAEEQVEDVKVITTGAGDLKMTELDPEEAERAEITTEDEKARKARVYKTRLQLLFCILLWGCGFFIVSIPNSFDDAIKEDWIIASFPIALGRWLGMIGIILTVSSQSYQTFYNFMPLEVLRSVPSILAIMCPLVGCIGYICYDFLLLMGGDLNVISAIVSLHVAIPVFYAILILREPVSFRKAFGLTLSLLAIVLLSLSEGFTNPDGTPNTDTANAIDHLVQTIVLLCGVLVAWGGSLVLSTAAAKKLSFDHLLLSLFMGMSAHLVFSIITVIASDQLEKLAHFSIYVKVAGHIVASGGFVLFSLLTSQNQASQYAALASLYAIVPMILGIIVFEETVTAINIVGGCLTLVAIYILSD